MTLSGSKRKMLMKIAMANDIYDFRKTNPSCALLHYASIGNVLQARAALRAGANVNVKDNAGFTPLQRCVRSTPGAKMGPMMKLLLKVGADERMRDGLDVKDEVTSIKAKAPMLIMKSVETWRKKRSFCLVSKSFLGVKMNSDKPQRKRSKYEPATFFPPDPSLGHFLEVNLDILNEVFKFLV